MRKIAMIGGAGVRTPLLIHALAESQKAIALSELALFDIDRERAGIIARLGREVASRLGATFEITTPDTLEASTDGAAAVLSSIRVGGITARARDERIAIDHGLAGQETTGPGGAAMALRTIPVTVEHARIVERVAPKAWFISFTNPAGLITQALRGATSLPLIGICDTPVELFHRIAWSLHAPYEEMRFDYAGLNHLGWVRRVMWKGEDITGRILSNREIVEKLYPADLFDPELIRTLRLIPTEYLFFYYSQRRAHSNQLRAGASRGEEIERMNRGLFEQLASAPTGADAIDVYRRYLLMRNSSYMKLEAQGESAFEIEQDQYDPFDTITGYHRIAQSVLTGLFSDQPVQAVVNVANEGAIDDLPPDDVVEVPCEIGPSGPRPLPTGPLPESVRGLVLAVKAYERATIDAARSGSASKAQLAMMLYPIIGQWELAGELLASLQKSDPEHLGYLR